MSEVGFLLATAPEDWDPYVKKFIRKLGNRANVTVLPPKGANGNPDDIRRTAEYMVNYFDVIVTAGTAAALICKEATRLNKHPPVVFASVGDAGLSELDKPQPGRWYTGGSNGQVKFVRDRVDFMLGKPATFKPPFAVVGYYKNDPKDPATAAMDAAYTYLSGKVGPANVKWGKIQNNEKMPQFIDRLKALPSAPQSLYCCSDLRLTANAAALSAAADAESMATMWEFEEHKTIHHGKDAKGVDFTDMFEHAAEQVLDILVNGATPDSLAIYEPALSFAARRTKRRKSGGRKKR